jgi:phosphatidate cytidylyltransferase
VSVSLAGAPARPGGELRARVASGVVLAGLVLAATMAGGVAFALVWLVAAVAVAWEWLGVTGARPRLPLAAALAVGLAATAAGVAWGGPRFALGGLALAVVALLVVAADGRSRAWALAGLAVAAVIAAVPAWLREDPRIAVFGPLWLYGVVWVADTAAYFTGRALGGPKLWPAVSPKKTWSGFLGGVSAGGLAGTLVLAEAGRRGLAVPPLPALVLFSVAGAALGQGGDLAESALKRAFGVKDSGSLIPGHGGVMDRLDAFWAACLAALAARLVWPH